MKNSLTRQQRWTNLLNITSSFVHLSHRKSQGVKALNCLPVSVVASSALWGMGWSVSVWDRSFIRMNDILEYDKVRQLETLQSLWLPPVHYKREHDGKIKRWYQKHINRDWSALRRCWLSSSGLWATWAPHSIKWPARLPAASRSNWFASHLFKDIFDTFYRISFPPIIKYVWHLLQKNIFK